MVLRPQAQPAHEDAERQAGGFDAVRDAGAGLLPSTWKWTDSRGVSRLTATRGRDPPGDPRCAHRHDQAPAKKSPNALTDPSGREQ